MEDNALRVMLEKHYEDVKKEKRCRYTERQTWMRSEIHPLHGSDERCVLGDCVREEIMRLLWVTEPSPC